MRDRYLWRLSVAGAVLCASLSVCFLALGIASPFLLVGLAMAGGARDDPLLADTLSHGLTSFVPLAIAFFALTAVCVVIAERRRPGRSLPAGIEEPPAEIVARHLVTPPHVNAGGQGRSLSEVLLERRSGRRWWVHLLWLPMYSFLAALPLAVAFTQHSLDLPELCLLLLPLVLLGVQLHRPTILGWALIVAPLVVYAGASVVSVIHQSLEGYGPGAPLWLGPVAFCSCVAVVAWPHRLSEAELAEQAPSSNTGRWGAFDLPRFGFIEWVRLLTERRSRRGWWAYLFGLIAFFVCAFGLASQSLFLRPRSAFVPFVAVLLPTAIVAFQWYRPTILGWLVILALTARGIAESLPSVLSPSILRYAPDVLALNALALTAFICMATAGWPRANAPRTSAST